MQFMSGLIMNVMFNLLISYWSDCSQHTECVLTLNGYGKSLPQECDRARIMRDFGESSTDILY